MIIDNDAKFHHLNVAGYSLAEYIYMLESFDMCVSSHVWVYICTIKSKMCSASYTVLKSFPQHIVDMSIYLQHIYNINY